MSVELETDTIFSNHSPPYFFKKLKKVYDCEFLQITRVFYVNSTQAGVVWEEKISTEKMAPSGWLVGSL